MLIVRPKIEALDKPKLDPLREVSWSMYSTYKFNKEKWWHKYVYHGKCTKEFCVIKNCVDPFCPVVASSPEMDFGKVVGKKLETDPTYLPEIRRHGVMEYKFKTKWKRIRLVGYADMHDLEERLLDEFKTGRNPWTQKKVDDHGQITKYLLMNYLLTGIRPEEYVITLWWLPTVKLEDGTIAFAEPFEIQKFETTRTLAQCLEFVGLLEKTYKEMNDYAKRHAWPVGPPPDFEEDDY